MNADHTWKGGSAAWWAVTVVLAGLAVAGLTMLRTVQVASQPEPAGQIFAAALRAPTADALTSALRAGDAGEPPADDEENRVIRVRSDLVVIDTTVADAQADFDAVVNAAVAARAEALRTGGLPADPGPARTVVGVPRRLLESLTETNHGALAGAVRWSAILTLALLGWTVLQARDDNLLVLPAAALGTGWVLAQAALGFTSLLLSDVSPGSAATLRVIDRASEIPMRQLTWLAVAAVAAAACYRVLTLARLRLVRRRTNTSAASTAAIAASQPHNSRSVSPTSTPVASSATQNGRGRRRRPLSATKELSSR